MGNWGGLLSASQKTQLAGMDSQTGIQCLLDMWLNYTNNMPGGLYCNATWDTWYCWPPTQAGTVATVPCSVAFQQGLPYHASYLEGNATRTCLENGTWSQGPRTNYDECANSYEAYQLVNNHKNSDWVVVVVQFVLFIGSLLSLGCLLASLICFCTLRSVRCDRVTVNTHLMVALLIRFALLVAITEPFVFNRKNHYRDNDMICKGIIIAYLYGTMASVGWMFVQGLYITTSLVTVVPTCVSMQRHFRIYYFFGWVLPAILLAIYICTMAIRSEQQWCWKGYAATHEMYILFVPMFTAILLNLGFIINIARIVYQKVQRSRSQGESSQLKATVKATAILFLVLGVHNLLAVLDIGEYQDYLTVVNSGLGSTQGIVVSYLYCFSNKDVNEAVKRWFNRLKTTWTFVPGNRERRLTHQHFSLQIFSKQSGERETGFNSPVDV